MNNQDIEQAVEAINENWSICDGKGRCLDKGAIFDSNLDMHIMSSDDVKAILTLINEEVRKARVDEWRAILGVDFDKFYPTDTFNDFIKVPSFWINQQISEINMNIPKVLAELQRKD